MRRETAAGVVLGIGLGGFLDGIVLHQVAQWHTMGSAIVPPVTMETMSRNMLWDGLFHLGTWTITLVGVFFLWDVGRRGTPTSALRPFVGQLLIGWGAFNLVEGLVDQQADEECRNWRTWCNAPGLVPVDPTEVRGASPSGLPAHHDRREVERLQVCP